MLNTNALSITKSSPNTTFNPCYNQKFISVGLQLATAKGNALTC